ncbi:MAG: HDOD domain-containing protein [Lachnospiraceae bacterium]|nr:HDOD domain-containing protein [Lachnospiraceae bacterium]
MLATLIPLFDETEAVKAYSLFTQRKNSLLNPSMFSTATFDGAGSILGLELIDQIGLETIASDKEVFIEVSPVSVYVPINEQCKAPHDKIVLLMDPRITPDESTVARLHELKNMGYKLAMRKLAVIDFEKYRPILLLLDYVLLNHAKIDIEKAKIYFGRLFPNIKLCAVNVNSQKDFDKLKAKGGYELYEGQFFRAPVKKSEREVAPLKVNYIELINVVNAPDFDLTKAADVIGRDTGLVVSLLKIANRLSVNSEVTSIRHAVAMLGQKELKRWINTAVTKELCADKPNEIMRYTLIRARFAEELAGLFDMAGLADELFLMGLFSFLDVMLDKPMKEALKMVKVSKEIEKALTGKGGELAPVLDFIHHYEAADWQEVSRLLILQEIDDKSVYEAYQSSMEWYHDLFA